MPLASWQFTHRPPQESVLFGVGIFQALLHSVHNSWKGGAPNPYRQRCNLRRYHQTHRCTLE